MDPTRRERYLQVLGIEPWVPRIREPDPVHAAQQPGTSVASAPPVAATAATPAPAVVEAASAPAPAVAPAAPPGDWTGLQAAVASCRRCRLCETRTNTVFGIGPREAPLMVVGEAPGAEEDARGEPFVGRAGQLLDEMLKAIGRSRRTDTFIANVTKCRPPNNREPAEDEAEACRPFLEAQLQLVKPRLIVALGRVAAQRLLASDTPIGKMRGQRYTWGPAGTPLMVTYHPAYLLRSPGEKAKTWEDLKAVHRFLAQS